MFLNHDHTIFRQIHPFSFTKIPKKRLLNQGPCKTLKWNIVHGDPEQPKFFRINRNVGAARSHRASSRHQWSVMRGKRHDEIVQLQKNAHKGRSDRGDAVTLIGHHDSMVTQAPTPPKFRLIRENGC